MLAPTSTPTVCLKQIMTCGKPRTSSTAHLASSARQAPPPNTRLFAWPVPTKTKRAKTRVKTAMQAGTALGSSQTLPGALSLTLLSTACDARLASIVKLRLLFQFHARQASTVEQQAWSLHQAVLIVRRALTARKQGCYRCLVCARLGIIAKEVQQHLDQPTQ